MSARYRDRTDAGQQLAGRLLKYTDRPDLIVLALPRGGVPVGFEVAVALRSPLDVFIVRKLGLPDHAEVGMGAIATGGVRILDERVVRAYGVTEAEIAEVTEIEQRELERRERRYRGDREPPDVGGRCVILVDDGLATGSTMLAAVTALRKEQAGRIVVAVPIAPPETCDAFRDVVDDIVCVMTPEPFYAVGLWYEDFTQTTDDEVHELLDRAAREIGHDAHAHP